MSADGRTGVVLAAGFGSRLKGVVDSTELKPLTPVAGKPLIQRTLESLEVAGCHRVVIVLGHHAETMQHGIEDVYEGGLELVFAMNERFEKQNGLSVLAARPYVAGDFTLTMADHVFGDEVMEVARSYSPEPGHAALLVDYKLESIFDMDDATKVVVKDG
ncbi:MAG: NTP transferase domain-containing protein, partial [Rubricoccaceae bacterium]|nr:NTP transferase domain-containing protein [Rubricoccaceae bacterium]